MEEQKTETELKQPEIKQSEIKSKDNNIIFIGEKPLMNYINAINMQFNKGMNEVIIKARGQKFIGKGVDVAEVSRKKFLLTTEMTYISCHVTGGAIF